MERLVKSATEQDFAVIPAFKAIDKSGIESQRVADALQELNVALDEQAVELDEWREHVIQLLLRPLVDEENDEITGDEYEQSTKLQDEILVYLQILRTALADRHAALTGQKNFLVEHETKVAARMALAGEGPFPEKLLELLKGYEVIKPPFVEGDPLTSMRGLVSELRGLSAKLRHEAATGSSRAANELSIVSGLLKSTLSHQTEQTKAATAMEKEIERFMDTLNARIEYYRQLQEVSDTVGEYEGSLEEGALEDALKKADKEEGKLQEKLNAAEAKHRYREYLGGEESQGRLLTVYSCVPQGGRDQHRGATDVYYLPVDLHDWRLDSVRPLVLQGLHHLVVQGASHLSGLQEAAPTVESLRHHAEAAGAQGALGNTPGQQRQPGAYTTHPIQEGLDHLHRVQRRPVGRDQEHRPGRAKLHDQGRHGDPPSLVAAGIRPRGQVHHLLAVQRVPGRARAGVPAVPHRLHVV
jgi:hypothetical protein